MGLRRPISKFHKAPPGVSFNFSAIGFLLTSLLVLAPPPFGVLCLDPLLPQGMALRASVNHPQPRCALGLRGSDPQRAGGIRAEGYSTCNRWPGACARDLR